MKGREVLNKNENNIIDESERERIILDNSHSKKTVFIFDLFKTIMYPLAFIAFFLCFVLRPVTVDGNSMNDTLFDGDKILLTNMFYTPQSGDIVVVAHGGNLQKRIIKRVIATEGQSIKIDYSTGDVYVDGIIIDEPYIKGTTTKPVTAYEIPEVIPNGMVFVMGDNRPISADSRSSNVGLIPANDIIGKANFIIFPRFTVL